MTEKIEQIRSLVHVYERKRSPGQGTSKRAEESVDLLVEAYTSRRRALDPLYRPSVTDRNALRTLVKRLEFRNVTRSQWPAYLDHAFEVFPNMTKGRCSFPPAKVAASAGLVDNFVSSLGERRLDFSRAPAILARGGFEDVDANVAITIARKIASGGRMPRGLDERTEEAIRYLADRLAEVGYRLDE